MIRVGIFNEFIHEREEEKIRAIYPQGIHMELAGFLKSDDIEVKTYTLENVEDLTPEELKTIDVLLWWGHVGHAKVPDQIAANVQEACLSGMGMIFLHSGHHSKPFRLLMGTPCHLTWREDGDMERVWNINPSHPITQGIGRYFELAHEETYGEPFIVPEPDELILIGWYEGGEVFRSGCTYKRGNGKIFYFQPGHESFPTYKYEAVQTVIRNAVYWAAPTYRHELSCPHVKKPGEE